MSSNPFDAAAATWEQEPRRVALAKAIGQSIVDAARPDPTMDLLDYGCGTGLLTLYLLPYVRSATGADNSRGMLDVLGQKIRDRQIPNMRTLFLDLEHDRVPEARYQMVVSGMTLHHIARLDRALAALHALLCPGGVLCLADLDTEPGTFHSPEAAADVHHLGFDRDTLQRKLEGLGFIDPRATTATTVRKPTGGVEREYSVFLMTARRPATDG